MVPEQNANINVTMTPAQTGPEPVTKVPSPFSWVTIAWVSVLLAVCYAPVLNRLGSQQWAKTKARVRKAMQDMTAELLRLYAERTTAQGTAFSKDNEFQKEFEDYSDAWLGSGYRLICLERLASDKTEGRETC